MQRIFKTKTVYLNLSKPLGVERKSLNKLNAVIFLFHSLNNEMKIIGRCIVTKHVQLGCFFQVNTVEVTILVSEAEKPPCVMIMIPDVWFC